MSTEGRSRNDGSRARASCARTRLPLTSERSVYSRRNGESSNKKGQRIDCAAYATHDPTVDPLEIERLKESMSPTLSEFLGNLEREEVSKVPADVIRTLAFAADPRQASETVDSWRFVYEAIRHSVIM